MKATRKKAVAQRWAKNGEKKLVRAHEIKKKKKRKTIQMKKVPYNITAL